MKTFSSGDHTFVKFRLFRQCLFCHQRQNHCWSYFSIKRTWLVVLVM